MFGVYAVVWPIQTPLLSHPTFNCVKNCSSLVPRSMNSMEGAQESVMSRI